MSLKHVYTATPITSTPNYSLDDADYTEPNVL